MRPHLSHSTSMSTRTSSTSAPTVPLTSTPSLRTSTSALSMAGSRRTPFAGEAYGPHDPQMIFAAIVVFGYLLGSCPWGYWLPRIFFGGDVRLSGSGSTRGPKALRAPRPPVRVMGIVVDAL